MVYTIVLFTRRAVPLSACMSMSLAVGENFSLFSAARIIPPICYYRLYKS